ncbi:hypothetical protein V8E55_011843 [Tylopilus felleus]
MLTEADHRVQAANGGCTCREIWMYQAYHKLVWWIPSIYEIPQADLAYTLQQLTLGAESWVIKWLMYHTPSPELRLTPEDKSGRGFHNEMTGQLLCPIDYDWNNATGTFHPRQGKGHVTMAVSTPSDWCPTPLIGGHALALEMSPSNWFEEIFNEVCPEGEVMVTRATETEAMDAEAMGNKAMDTEAIETEVLEGMQIGPEA